MKLYTEEQVKEIASYFNFPIKVINEVLELTPIELPSDEDIWEKILDSAYSLEYDTGFAQGAKWVINNIKQQDK
jgi:hypothetical protein